MALLHFYVPVFHKRKFTKVKSEPQVSFVNEAPGFWIQPDLIR
jgi:hypothetical protein